jgi:uncharacterized membrane protein YhaH (DUF805 family)
MRYLFFLFFSIKGNIGRLPYFLGSFVPDGLILAAGKLALVIVSSYPVLGSAVIASVLIVAGICLFMHIAVNVKRFRGFGAERWWWLCLIPVAREAAFVILSTIKTNPNLSGPQ